MDNCYGKRDRIPRELLPKKDDRLTNKHIQTLTFLQDIVNENNLLQQRKEELEKEREKCQEIHALAEDSQLRIKDLEENCLKRADEVNQMLAEQHRNEMMQVLDDKEEAERSMKEEILKLRHELESLKQTNLVLRKDTEWQQERKTLQHRVTELELLAEGLQLDTEQKKAERGRLQTSLDRSRALHSELHQLQNLRSLLQTLTEELKETHQKNQEFALKIQKLQQELKDKSSEEQLLKLLEALKNKSAKLLRERELSDMRTADVTARCQDVTDLNRDLEAKIGDLERDCGKVAKDLVQLKMEHGKVARRLQHGEDSSAAAKEFWAVKRELGVLKEENDVLRQKVRASSSCSLPALKDRHTPSQTERPLSKTKGKKKLLSAVSSVPGELSPLS